MQSWEIKIKITQNKQTRQPQGNSPKQMVGMPSNSPKFQKKPSVQKKQPFVNSMENQLLKVGRNSSTR